LNTSLRLIVTDLACTLGNRRLFSALSFSVGSGEAVAVTGPNGSGKTTLLRLLAGFTAREDGQIRLEGTTGDIGLRESIHFVGHRDGQKAALTVRENLTLGAAVSGAPSIDVMDSARQLDLTPLLDLPVGVLSAGQRRRAALARLLTVVRPIWLLDEPTSALDIRSQDLVRAMIASHVSAGGMVIAATHLPLGINSGEIAFLADGGHEVRGCAR
jgi:heme exporter protein A